MKIKRLLSICLLMLPALQSYAQNSDYVIEVTAGKKVLNVDNLNLPPTTTAYEILNIFPELLAREGDKALSNYDVQVNGISMGASKENVLVLYKLSDIKSIEVSPNPSTSQQKNGQGGVIKLNLKDLKEGFSGNASLYASSTVQAQPGLQLGYRKNSWTVRSSLLMEYYSPFNENSMRQTIYPNRYTYTTDTSSIQQGYEILSLDAVYQPDSRNKLHLWADERLTLDGIGKRTAIEVNSISEQQRSDEFLQGFRYLVGAKYEHHFNSSTFETEWSFDGEPQKYYKYIYTENIPRSQRIWQYDCEQNQNLLQGLAKYTYHFVPSKPQRKADLSVGANFNTNPLEFWHTFSQHPDNIKGGIQIPMDSELKSSNRTTYLSPYIESNNEFGKWYLKAGLRFQHYVTHIRVKGKNNFDRPENYFTAFLNLGCQVAPHHHLSMIIDRSITRPASYTTYPYMLFAPDLNYFTLGNPTLEPVSVHNVTLNYITDFRIGEKYFTFDTELKYIKSDKLLVSEKQEDAIHYRNDGMSDIFAANLLFFFKYNYFSLKFAGNFFSNFNTRGSVQDRYNYFNLSVIPSLHFDNGWNASVRFTYNSHIYTSQSRLSDYFYTVTEFSKSWNKLTAYLELSDNFHEQAMDEIYGKALSETLYYNLHRPCLKLGVNFRF